MRTRATGLALGAVAAALLAEGLPPGARPAAAVERGARHATASPAVAVALLAVAATSLAAALVGARMASDRIGRPRRDGPAGNRAAAILPVVAGAMLVATRVGLGSAIGSPATGMLPDGEGPWPAVVESVGTPHDARQQVILRFESPAGLRVAASLPRFPGVEPVERVELSGPLSPPGDDGYGDYLRRARLAGSLRATRVTVLGRADGPLGALEGLRRAGGDALSRALPEPEAGLAAGILIGLRDRVDRDVASAFTTAGISHVVAISGWNIAIVAAAVAAVTGRWSRRRRALLTLAAVLCYTLLAGASASVVRAAAMAAVVSLAREAGRGIPASIALAWAAVALLLLEPRTILDPGFQLSALATAGLIAWATPLAARLGRLRRRGLSVPWWLAESLAVSLAAQAATLPLVLVLFGRLALVAPAVNLAVVPLVPASMAAGLVALAAGFASGVGLPDPVVAVVALPAWFLLTAMVRLAEGAAGLPFASVALEPPWSVLAAAVAGALTVLVARWRSIARAIRPGGRARREGLATAALPIGRPSRPTAAGRRPRPTWLRHLRRPLLLLAGASLVLTLVAATRPDGRAHVTMLDVGQGDAILVESAQGGRLLVDGGPDPDRLLALLDRALPPWDRRLDLVVLTHPHEDHVAGLPLVLRRYRVGRVFAPGPAGDGPGYAAFVDAVRARGLRPEPLRTGDRLRLDEVALRVLWPDASAVPEATPGDGRTMNDVSIVLLGDADGRRFLLTGDAEDDVDPVLVGRGLPRIDLLKVAHHGSRTATSDALLAASAPSVALVSVGAANTYGHPSPATLGRLVAHGVRTYRSDLEGTVRVALAPDGISVGGDRLVGRSSPLLYHPDDVGSGAGRGRLPPALTPPTGVVPAALARGGRGRRLARLACHRTREPARPIARRSCRAPP